MGYPILYSLRQCPYAMRARIGLLLARQTVLLRDIVMKNKPPEMLAASQKATVPVLVLEGAANGVAKVIDESLDIMLWALHQSDPQNVLYSDHAEVLPQMLELINRYDNEFVGRLKKYKAAARYRDDNEVDYREQCHDGIVYLEQHLTANPFLFGDKPALADYAILPFIRQFSRVDRKWFQQAPYPNLQRWLNSHLQSPLYTKAMAKYPIWLEHRKDILFGG